MAGVVPSPGPDRSSLTCPSCNGSLSLTTTSVIDLQECPACHQELVVKVFPAIHRGNNASPTGKRVIVEDESSCFFHTTKRADAACETCGRFLCALCETPFAGKILCPECLERAESEGELEELVTLRYRHGSIALMIALVPLLFWPLTLITAPIAIGYAIKYWNAKGSLVTASHFSHVSAIMIGLIELGIWAFVGFTFFLV